MRLFLLTNTEGDPSEFDRLVRQQLLPLVQDFDSVRSYEVFRVDGVVESSDHVQPPQYVDVIEVTSLAEYLKDLEDILTTSAGNEFEDSWTELVGSFISVYVSKVL